MSCLSSIMEVKVAPNGLPSSLWPDADLFSFSTGTCQDNGLWNNRKEGRGTTYRRGIGKQTSATFIPTHWPFPTNTYVQILVLQALETSCFPDNISWNSLICLNPFKIQEVWPSALTWSTENGTGALGNFYRFGLLGGVGGAIAQGGKSSGVPACLEARELPPPPAVHC